MLSEAKITNHQFQKQHLIFLKSHLTVTISPFLLCKQVSESSGQPYIESVGLHYAVLWTCRGCGAQGRSIQPPTPWSTPSCCAETQTTPFLSAVIEKRPYDVEIMFFFHLFHNFTRQGMLFHSSQFQDKMQQRKISAFPINISVISKLKAGKWSLEAGLYLASSSLTFFFNRDFLNALLCLSKWSLDKNICDCC